MIILTWIKIKLTIKLNQSRLKYWNLITSCKYIVIYKKNSYVF